MTSLPRWPAASRRLAPAPRAPRATAVPSSEQRQRRADAERQHGERDRRRGFPPCAASTEAAPERRPDARAPHRAEQEPDCELPGQGPRGREAARTRLSVQLPTGPAASSEPLHCRRGSKQDDSRPAPSARTPADHRNTSWRRGRSQSPTAATNESDQREGQRQARPPAPIGPSAVLAERGCRSRSAASGSTQGESAVSRPASSASAIPAMAVRSPCRAAPRSRQHWYRRCERPVSCLPLNTISVLCLCTRNSRARSLWRSKSISKYAIF